MDYLKEEKMKNQSTEAYLLGLAHGALMNVQKHLIQDQQKEALSVCNESLRELHAAISKLYYSAEEKNDAN